MQIVNAQPGKRNGIALLLAAGLLAVLIAVVFAFAPGVGAHDCADDLGTNLPDVHKDTDGDACGTTRHSTSSSHAALSSTEPSTQNVAIKLTATAEATISGNATITVDFSGPTADSGFSIPANITNTDIEIDPDVTETTTAPFSPSSPVQVDGKKVILTVPSGENVSKDDKYAIIFNTAAGIGNPNPPYEGPWRIIVSSDVTGDAPDTITALTGRTRITPWEGPRGETFRIRGNDYPEGTVTIFDGENDIVDEGEILDTREVTSSGTFTSRSLTAARGQPGDLFYVIRTIDSEGVLRRVIFSITEPTVSFEPSTAEPSTAEVISRVTINITDWQLGDTGVGAVHIAGREAYIAKVTEYTNCYEYTDPVEADDNVVSFPVMVPEGVLRGHQTVSIYDTDAYDTGVMDASKLPCTTDAPGTGTPTRSNEKVTRKPNAMPVIQKTIEIVSELPKPARRVNIFEVDGGLDQELEFEVNPPREDPGSYFDTGDKIEISLLGFDLSGAAFNPQEQRELIEIMGSSDDTHITPTGVVPDDINKKLILTLPGSTAHGADEHLIITIKQGTGILTPEIPRGFDDDEGYPVTITFIDADSAGPGIDTDDENIVVVKNPISSTVPGATVRVELVAYADVVIGSSEEIVVDFSGPSLDSEFFVPASISNTRVSIRSGGRTFNPSEVQVQGARVILTIPSGTNARTVEQGEFTIIFTNLARIRNPFAAGTRDIKVLSFVQGDLEDVIKAVIRRTTTIDTLEGPRGTEFILQGKGYARGTVTVYHDADCDGNIDAGETLASDNTIRGAFSVDLVAREPRDLGCPPDLRPFDPLPFDPLHYWVKAKDSEGVDDEVEFRIRSGMFFQPSPARVGSPLKITISDWQANFPDVAAVSIAGKQAYVAEVREYAKCFDYAGVFRPNSDGVVSLEVDVPRFVPGGEQTVAVYDHEQLEHVDRDGDVVPEGPCVDLPNPEDKGNPVNKGVTARLKSEPIAIIKATIEIDTEDLTLSPATAARGQKVTIIGSGFSRAARGSDHIDSVWIGGKRVDDDPSGFEVGTEGNIAFAVTVPLDVADGPNEVRVEGSDDTLGQAILTVPDASIALEPSQGQRGTKFTVTGSGFIAREVVILTYGPEGSPYGDDIVLADSQGKFELTFTVPLTAKIGSSHKVRAVADADTSQTVLTVDAEASHLVLGVTITTSPESVSPGDRLTIRAQNLPSFTRVGPISIEGIRVLDRSGVATTDENGSFETEVLVPNIEFGDQTLLVQVAEVIVPHIIKVAPPPLSGPPGRVFNYLIRDGNLLTVWSYDNATQSWSLFDPLFSGELAMLNDLTEVGSGDIVWLSLSRPQSFQGSDLAAGWNLISLK